MPVADSGAAQHFTEAPPRYTEASLIKFLEDNGIGRPSTFAQIVTLIISRGYVKREGKSLVPTPLGEITTKLVVKKGIDQDKLTDHAPDLGVQAHHRLFKFKKRKKKQAEILEAVDNQEEQ